jgi:TolB-like protein/class 3 adenylate cyclase/Flp pilus assembly protein TadD
MHTTRQLAAIMFTDMVGYTALMQTDEALANQKRERHKKVFESAIQKYHGKILQYYGDGTLSIFNSTIDGVSCAIEMQEQLRQDPRVDLRIGIHSGDIFWEDEGIYGDGVNIASRIESISVAGGVFISEKVFDDIKNQNQIQAREVGSFELKNVQHPMRVFAISNPGFPVPLRNEVKGKLNQPLNRLAILPFENISADPENEYFSDGITEELIDAFSKVNGLLVTSRTSCFAFKKKHEDAREIGNKLNVNKILEGSVRKAGNRVRITAQLINAADGYHVWSETFDRDLHDIFAVQDEIARIIVNKLRESIAKRPAEEQFVKPPTDNMEAYSLYLKGIHFRNRLTIGDLRKAVEYFEQAIKLDPRFAHAYANCAGVYAQLGGMGQMNPQKAFETVHFYANKALELDNSISESYTIKGAAYMFADWNWSEAYQYLSKALQLNPGSSYASLMMSIYYLLHGRLQESIDTLEKALEHDPLSLVLMDSLSERYFYARRYGEAIVLTEKLLELDPQMRHALETKGFCLAMQGNWEEAIKIFKEVYRLTNHPLKGLTPLAYAYAKTGQLEKVNECLAKTEQRMIEEPQAVPEADMAMIWLALGDKDKAFHYIFRALDKHMPVCYSLQSPLLDDVKDDPRVEELRRRMNL